MRESCRDESAYQDIDVLAERPSRMLLDCAAESGARVQLAYARHCERCCRLQKLKRQQYDGRCWLVVVSAAVHASLVYFFGAGGCGTVENTQTNRASLPSNVLSRVRDHHEGVVDSRGSVLPGVLAVLPR